jgi:hypothetical protein
LGAFVPLASVRAEVFLDFFQNGEALVVDSIAAEAPGGADAAEKRL